MNRQKQFNQCLAAARAIVKAYRAAAPAGFDPVALDSLTGGPDTPPPRNITKEFNQVLKGYQNTAGGFLDLEREFGPQYGQLNLQMLDQQLMGYTDPETGRHVPGTLELSRASRRSDVSDAYNLGPGLYQSYLRSSPLAAELNRTALEGLRSGGQLSPQELRTANQQSRGSYAAHGMAYTTPAFVGEILNRDAVTRQRQQQAQQFATGVAGLTQAGAQGLLPTITGRPVPNAAVPYSQMYSPTGSNYFQDLFNTNYNAQAAANIAGSNQNAALWSSLLGAVGTAAGAYFGGPGGAAIGGAAGRTIGSDRRLKEKIVRKGKSPSGIPEYEFSYKGEKRRFHGPMAQDVEKVRPDAVITLPLTGHKLVDLSKIDAAFYEVPRLYPDDEEQRRAA